MKFISYGVPLTSKTISVTFFYGATRTANRLNKKVTEGVHQGDTLPQIVGDPTKWGLSTWASMRNMSILRRYASAIAGPSALTRARFWTNSVQCAVISASTPSGCWGASLSASTPSGCWGASLPNRHDVLDGLRNMTSLAADGIAQAMACHGSDVQQAAGGCHATVVAAL